MKNQMKTYYQIMTVAGIVGGIILLVWPGKTMIAVCYILAGLLCVLGAAKVIVYLTKKDTAFFKYDLVVGTACVAGGIFIFVKPNVIISFFPIVLGIVVIVSSMFKLQNSIDLYRTKAKGWWAISLLAVAGIVLGIVMMAYRFGTAVTLTRFIGIVLVANGVSDAISMVCVNARIKNMEKRINAVETDGEVLE